MITVVIETYEFIAILLKANIMRWSIAITTRGNSM